MFSWTIGRISIGTQKRVRIKGKRAIDVRVIEVLLYKWKYQGNATSTNHSLLRHQKKHSWGINMTKQTPDTKPQPPTTNHLSTDKEELQQRNHFGRRKKGLQSTCTTKNKQYWRHFLRLASDLKETIEIGVRSGVSVKSDVNVLHPRFQHY